MPKTANLLQQQSTNLWRQSTTRLARLFAVFGLGTTLAGTAVLTVHEVYERSEKAYDLARNIHSFVKTELRFTSGLPTQQKLLVGFRDALTRHDDDHWIALILVINEAGTVTLASQQGMQGLKISDALFRSPSISDANLLAIAACFATAEPRRRTSGNGITSNGSASNGVTGNGSADNGRTADCFRAYTQAEAPWATSRNVALPIELSAADQGLPRSRYLVVTNFDRRYFLAGIPAGLGRSLLISALGSVLLLAILCLLIRSRLLQDLREVSETDALTGLTNRAAFTDLSLKLLARAEADGDSYVLAILDLDFFKRINDTHGHRCGDFVLTSAGELLRNAVRPEDLVARLGGEEFAALVHCPRHQAQKVLERLRLQMELNRLQFEGQSVAVTMSIGAAETDVFGYNFDYLYAEADKALYQAKMDGRNRIRWAVKSTDRSGWNPGTAWSRSFAVEIEER